ncbi:hypothetical protein ElyMa_006300100 [Elysia marginata]|uniref:Uncharacterized protein n=1 Tax=Elysia marginata TaxID=1093978 RepID=A0AAV4HHF3_9GAST|nr:hypothetical protein ElyMa_006300100 [Elysia marginata]
MKTILLVGLCLCALTSVFASNYPQCLEAAQGESTCWGKSYTASSYSTGSDYCCESDDRLPFLKMVQISQIECDCMTMEEYCDVYPVRCYRGIPIIYYGKWRQLQHRAMAKNY